MKRYPTVSIITGTLDPKPSVFRRMLEAIVAQTYPKRLIEHVVVDGGSSDGTLALAIRFGCRLVSHPALRNKEQVRFAKGFSLLKGDIVLILESDNILPDSRWIERLVEPFVDERRVSFSFPAYNAYTQDMTMLTKYCALMGSPDPTLFYLKKSDKIPAGQTRYDKGVVLKEMSDYWIVRFEPEGLPTLGDNGFMVRREILALALKKNREYIHVDAFASLVTRGFDTAGVVKNEIIHIMGGNIANHVRRRIEVKRLFTDEKRGMRRYHAMDWSSPRDRRNLFKYIVFSLTLAQPLWVSIHGYLKIRELAWFLHPVMCLLMVAGYGWSEVVFQLKHWKKLVLDKK